MIKEYFKSWNKFEIILVTIGTIGVILFGFIFKSAILTMICSIVNIATAMLQAKGKVESQFLCLIGCILYSIISYHIITNTMGKLYFTYLLCFRCL